MATKIKYSGRKNTKRRHVIGYFTKITMFDDSECFIGASTKKQVEKLWKRLSVLDIDWSKVTRCRIFKDT